MSDMTDPPIPEVPEPQVFTPGPVPAAPSMAASHPIRLLVTDDLRRSRVTTFFRYLLAIPHLIWQGLWGLAAFVAVVIAWFAGLILGRVPDGLHNFIAGYVRYSTRVAAYVYLAANPFPSFTNTMPYPVDVEIAPAARQGRLGIFFRNFLAIPAIIALYALSILLLVVSIAAWFMGLFAGRIGDGMRDAFAFVLRFNARTTAYLFLLTSKYPSFKE